MPTYEYICPKCNALKEKFHSIKDNPEIICPSCGEIMNRGVGGGSGYIMKTGSTRRQTDKARYGKKKKFSTPTPTESAFDKGQKLKEEIASRPDPSDPYKQFR